MWINLLTQSFLSVLWFCIVNLSDGWDLPGISLYKCTRSNLPISSNKKRVTDLSTFCRVSISLFPKTWLVKCSKRYGTILLRLLQSTSDFVYFEWTDGKNNCNCSHLTGPLNKQILKDIDQRYRKISIANWHCSFDTVHLTGAKRKLW